MKIRKALSGANRICLSFSLIQSQLYLFGKLEQRSQLLDKNRIPNWYRNIIHLFEISLDNLIKICAILGNVWKIPMRILIRIYVLSGEILRNFYAVFSVSIIRRRKRIQCFQIQHYLG